MTRMRSVFVSGTDTDVGKTVVACALAREVRARGVDLGVMKPVETGVPTEGPLDARALRAAAGSDDDLSLVCPLQFGLPATPEAAAAAEGRDVDLGVIQRAFETLSARHDAMLVEGAGGLLVPVREELAMVDFAKQLGLPILLVARAALGTINHTLLSLEACERRGAEVLGVVVSHSGGALSDADSKNLEILKARLGPQLLAEIPPLGNTATEGPAPGLLAPVADRMLSLD